jgi:ferritin-like metal-binding protein YciE
VAAGWLAATAVGAAAGAATGGVVGALTQAGVSDEDAHSYDGTLKTWATERGYSDAVKLLDATLQEEKNAKAR